MTPAELDAKYNPDGDGEHPTWTRETWRVEVGLQNTVLGYWEWVSHRLEEEPDEPAPPAEPTERLVLLDVQLAFAIPKDDPIDAVYDLANCLLIPRQRNESPDSELIDYTFALHKPSECATTVAECLNDGAWEDPQPQVWEASALVISTGHVSRSTADWLTARKLGEVPSVATYAEGWWVRLAVPEQYVSELPDDLLAIITWAREFKDSTGQDRYNWVRLDADGDHIPGLPIYEW